jgi:hypothetical protein
MAHPVFGRRTVQTNRVLSTRLLWLISFLLGSLAVPQTTGPNSPIPEMRTI